MKRRLVKLVVFLILGSIINVAVAWGCAIYSDALIAPTEKQTASKEELEQLKSVGWKPTTETDDWRYTHSVFKWRGYGVSEFYIVERVEMQDTIGFEIVGSFLFDFYFARISQAGWPLRCLSMELLDPSGNGQASLILTMPWRPLPHPRVNIGGLAIDRRNETPIENWQHSMSLQIPEKLGPIELPEDRYLPLDPIWSGLIINTIIYAAILWMMMSIASMSRQHSRFKKGHCTKCNYELKRDYSTGCPECGWGREAVG